MLACLGTVDVRQEYTFRILSLELEMPICRSLAFFYVFKPKIFHAHRMRPTGTHSYSIHFGSHLFPSQISTYLFAYDFVVVCVFFFWFVHSSFLSKSHGDKHIEKCKQTTFNVRTNEANEKQNKQAANSKQAKQLSMGDLTCISYTLICVIQNRISIESMRCHSNFGASNRYTINLWLMIPAINSFLRSDLPIWQ